MPKPITLVIPRYSNDETTFAIIRYDLHHQYTGRQFDNPSTLLAIVRSEITKMINAHHPAALRARDNAGDGLNIGDVITYDLTEPLAIALSNYGIVNFEIEIFSSEDTPAAWRFDTPLVETPYSDD